MKSFHSLALTQQVCVLRRMKQIYSHLLVSTVVTDGLVNNMAPGLLFAMLMVLRFTLLVIHRVAFFDPFRFGYLNFVLATLLALYFLNLSHHWYRN